MTDGAALEFASAELKADCEFVARLKEQWIAQEDMEEMMACIGNS